MLELITPDLLDYMPLLAGIQIGPRIRVGGTLGKIGQKAKIAVGKTANVVGKGVSFINPALGTAISAAGDVLDTTDGAFDFKKAATNAVKQYALGKTVNTVGKGVMNAVKGGAEAGAGGGGFVDRAKQMMGGLVKGGGSDGKGSFGAVGDFAGRALNPGGGGAPGEGGGMSLLDKLLLGGTVAAGAEDNLRRRQMQNQAIDYSRGAYDSKAPLRSRAMAMLEKDVRPNHSAIFADPGNVYAQPRSVAQ